MDSARPTDGATVWIEYPESKWVRASYSATDDSYKIRNRKTIAADEVATWSAENPSKKKAAPAPGNWFGRIAGGLLQIILDMF